MRVLSYEIASEGTPLSKLPTLSVPEDLFSQSLRTTRGPHSIVSPPDRTHISRRAQRGKRREHTQSNTHRNISHKRAVKCRVTKELHPRSETESPLGSTASRKPCSTSTHFKPFPHCPNTPQLSFIFPSNTLDKLLFGASTEACHLLSISAICGSLFLACFH